MTTQTASTDLLSRICRVTTLDRVAMTFAGLFLFGIVAVAALAYVSIGDAPQGRMWGFLASYAALGMAIGIVAPWAVCRLLHAAGHAAQISHIRRAARAQETAPFAPFLQGRTA